MSKQQYFDMDIYNISNSFYDYVYQLSIAYEVANELEKFKEIGFFTYYDAFTNSSLKHFASKYDTEHKNLLHLNDKTYPFMCLLKYDHGNDINGIYDILNSNSLMNLSIITHDIQTFKYLLLAYGNTCNENLIYGLYECAMYSCNYEVIHILEQMYNCDKSQACAAACKGMLIAFNKYYMKPNYRTKLEPILEQYIEIFNYATDETITIEMLMNGDKLPLDNISWLDLILYRSLSYTHFVNNFNISNDMSILAMLRNYGVSWFEDAVKYCAESNSITLNNKKRIMKSLFLDFDIDIDSIKQHKYDPIVVEGMHFEYLNYYRDLIKLLFKYCYTYLDAFEVLHCVMICPEYINDDVEQWLLSQHINAFEFFKLFNTLDYYKCYDARVLRIIKYFLKTDKEQLEEHV